MGVMPGRLDGRVRQHPMSYGQRARRVSAPLRPPWRYPRGYERGVIVQRCVLILCSLFLLTSCGTQGGFGTTASDQSAGDTTASSTPAVTKPPEPLALGESFTALKGATATAFQVLRPVAIEAAPPSTPNSEWVGVDVEVCLSPSAATGTIVTGEVWNVRDANNGQYNRAGRQSGQFPQPPFPVEQPAEAGQCFRGWIVFAVLIGVPLTEVVYGPDTLDPPFPNWEIPT